MWFRYWKMRQVARGKQVLWIGLGIPHERLCLAASGYDDPQRLEPRSFPQSCTARLKPGPSEGKHLVAVSVKLRENRAGRNRRSAISTSQNRARRGPQLFRALAQNRRKAFS